MGRRADPQFPQPAKSNEVGSIRSAFGKVPLFRFAVFTFLLLFHSCSGQNLEKIQAFTGETVILPCLIHVSGELPTVEWSKEGLTPNITFLYRDGCETFDMKNKVFRDRTNLFLNELKNGNISQMIFNVQLTDAGIYQCMVVRGKTREVVKKLELVVGAFSEPKLSVIPGAGSGLMLECEATCWFPKPEVTFIDDQGNTINPDNPKSNRDPRGCFNVTNRVTLSTAPNRVLCRVHEPQTNKTSVKEVYYIPGDCVISCIITVTITLLLVVLGMCASFFLSKKCVGAKISMPASEVPNDAGDAQENQIDINENCTDRCLEKIEELQNQLRDRNDKIFNLTAEVNQLKSRLSSNHTSKSQQRKECKQNPVSASSTSTPALFMNDGTNSSASSSSAPSDNNFVYHTRSHSHPSGNVTRSLRRNTYSASTSYHNRFSPLGKLNEESEKLLQH